jgi:hypothetical protein
MGFFNRTPEQQEADYQRLVDEQARAEAEAARYEAENPFEKYLQTNDNAKLIAEKNTNPDAYYSAAVDSMSNSIYENFIRNRSGRNAPTFQDLEKLKEINPQLYYNAQLKYLGQQLGWNHGQNTYEGTGEVQKQLQDLIPQAMKAGLSGGQIDSLINSTFAGASGENQQRIARDAASGGGGFSFSKDILPGIKFVGGSALAMTGLGAALAGGAGAGGAGVGALETAGAAGLPGGGAFVPAAGSGASFALPGFASSVAPLTTAEILSSSGFTPTTGSSFAIDPTAAYTTGIGAGTGAPVYDYSQPFSFEQMGPTYQELGVTGVEGGMAGPTYGELGYTGLNQSEAIAAADAASKGLTGADALKYINQARQGLNTANTLAKLLGSSAGVASGVKSANSSNGLNALANLLKPSSQTSDYLGQIKANQNPFTFTSPGQTVASPGMYDVSGSNMANALRKA